jgi:hypothetical protein
MVTTAFRWGAIAATSECHLQVDRACGFRWRMPYQRPLLPTRSILRFVLGDDLLDKASQGWSSRQDISSSVCFADAYYGITTYANH